MGDLAAGERSRLREASTEAEQIRVLAERAADSLSSFALRNTTPVNGTDNDRPFEWRYSIQADRYAKISADMMIVRPRVLGEWSNGLLETKEERRHPIEFDGPRRMTETTEITLPSGYTVDQLPQAVDVEYKFGAYHSKSEVAGNKIRYHRMLEIRQLSVAAAQATDLRQFNRAIFGDERRAAVLKRATAPCKLVNAS